MRHYVTPDGERISGETPEDVVIAMMRLSMFTEDKHPEDYMRAVSKRCAMLNATFIRPWSAAEFVSDLIRNKYLIEAH